MSTYDSWLLQQADEYISINQVLQIIRGEE